MDLLSSQLLNFINNTVGNINKLSPTKGGDIGKSYIITKGFDRYFLKVYSGILAKLQIKGELAGYELIQSTNTVQMPSVINSGYHEKEGYLILEYIEAKSPSKDDFVRFGYELRSLHNHTGNQYGAVHPNTIGSLFQSNKYNKDWPNFYATERLIPQLKLAIDSGFNLANKYVDETQMISMLSEFLSNVKPSIIHGDLWSGNFIIDQNGTPFLIDPAAYHGHSEVDIAMTKLFGGFDNAFYEGYYNNDMINFEYHEIYQLYYLLVHLNLFGVSYLGAVTSIMNKYFLKNA